MTKILVVEDDPLIAEDIQTTLEDEGYESDFCLHAEKAISKVTEFCPDLILLDISLNKGQSGIELGLKIKESSSTPIIFITSHSDRHTISLAKSINPVGYLVKPIQTHTLISTIEIGLKQSLEIKIEPIEIEHLFVKDKGKLVKVKLKDILFAEAYDNYTHLYTSSEKFLISSTLKKVEEKLSIESFKRVHRSFLVNLDHLDAIEDGYLFFGKHKVPVGRTFKDEIYRLIDTI